MGVAHRARASAGLDHHVMAASPSVVRPLWREGRPRSVGSKLAKKKNDEALWGDSAPVFGKVPAGYGLRYGSHSARATQIQAGIGARHTDAGGRCVRRADTVVT